MSASTGACKQFQAHAFISTKCINCGKSASAHVSTEETKHEPIAAEKCLSEKVSTDKLVVDKYEQLPAQKNEENGEKKEELRMIFGERKKKNRGKKKKEDDDLTKHNKKKVPGSRVSRKKKEEEEASAEDETRKQEDETKKRQFMEYDEVLRKTSYESDDTSTEEKTKGFSRGKGFNMTTKEKELPKQGKKNANSGLKVKTGEDGLPSRYSNEFQTVAPPVRDSGEMPNIQAGSTESSPLNKHEIIRTAFIGSPRMSLQLLPSADGSRGVLTTSPSIPPRKKLPPAPAPAQPSTNRKPAGFLPGRRSFYALSTSFSRPEDTKEIQKTDLTLEPFTPDNKNFFLETTRKLLRCFGLLDESINLILKDVELQMKSNWQAKGPPFFTKLYQPSPLLDKYSTFLLQKVVEDMQNFLQQQKEWERIIKVQAYVRGWLVRRRLRLPPETLQAVQRRNEIFIELLKTEAVYNQSIDTIIEVYLKPLRQLSMTNSNQAVEVQEVVTMFSNIEKLSEIHKEMFASLEGLRPKWPFIDGIGGVFKTKMLPNLDSYGNYAQNFQSAISTLQNIRTKKPKLWGLLQELRESCRDDLHVLLALPINRIHKYEYILELLLYAGKASMDSTDYEDIKRAYSRIRESVEFIRKCLEEGKETGRLADLQHRLVVPMGGTSLNLLVIGRHFVREGTFLSKTKKRYCLFLFNDIIVISKPISNSQRCVVKTVADLDTIAVEIIPDSGPTKYLFQIQLSANNKYQFAAASGSERATWVNDISSNSDRMKKKNKVFGAPLNDLLQREGRNTGIPLVVEAMVDKLREHSLHIPGLMRISGTQTTLESFRELFDQGNVKVDISSLGPHDAASLLKMYFLQLPEPLLTYELYDRFMFVLKKTDLELESRLAMIRSIINGGVPKANLPVIKYMINFFADICAHGDQNKMNAKNIGILVAPHFLHPREQTMENAQDLPYIHTLVEFLIENREPLFSDVELDSKLISRNKFLAPTS